MISGAARVDRAACGRFGKLTRCVGDSDGPQARQNGEGHRAPRRAGSTPARSALPLTHAVTAQSQES